MAKILTPTDKSIKICKEHLERSELVAVPTETVYGLAANALDLKAVEKIFKTKKRPLIDPLIVHCYSQQGVDDYAALNPLAKNLMATYWPGPLTLILRKKSCIPDLVSANLQSVALRSPNHPVFRQLLKALTFPLAAPSANPFGYVSPTQAIHVQESLGKRIDYILDGGACNLGIESTIIDVRDEGKPILLRPGPITKERLEEQIGVKIFDHSNTKNSSHSAITAPGLLKSHYSPHKSLKIIKRDAIGSLLAKNEAQLLEGCAIILSKRPIKCTANNLHWLSEDGSFNEISKNLYSLLRRIDQSTTYREILIEEIESKKMGAALMDRIQKAANN